MDRDYGYASYWKGDGWMEGGHVNNAFCSVVCCFVCRCRDPEISAPTFVGFYHFSILILFWWSVDRIAIAGKGGRSVRLSDFRAR